jgi:uncharacterized membrane protein YqgA involved in biofilm formation
MIGLGTIINTAAIILGGLAGGVFGKRLTERYQDTLMKACGLCVVFLGIAGALEKMFVITEGKVSSTGTMMMIASFAIGALIGEWLNIEHHMNRFGEWLKVKSGNSKDKIFVDAFVTASLTVCVGAMAIVGSIQDGILGDYNTLLMKAILDFVIICVMTASMGKGCAFSAIPVAIFQGSITLLARGIEPIMTETALNNLSLVGSMLIFCVGVNLIWDKKFKVANMLPAIVIAVAWAFI